MTHDTQNRSGRNVVVVGTQWGDEGKGKVVDWLTDRAQGVVRFQGGHNAGHTLVIERRQDRAAPHPLGHHARGRSLRHRQRRGGGPQAPAGRRSTGLERSGVEVRSRLRVERILPADPALPRASWTRRARPARNAAAGKIGTTGRGIGPAYEDKVGAARAARRRT
jgi:adenylosuccinate synthase